MLENATRTGRELLIATKPFAEESRRRTWLLLWSTLLALLAALTAAALVPWWPVRLAASLTGALLMVRAFIFFHDYQHGAILRDSRLARLVLDAVGLALLAPPRSWRHSHNYHHANVAKVDAPATGAFPVMSVGAWRRAPPWQRFVYRVSRHPLCVLAAGLTVFALNVTLAPLLRAPRRHWDSALALLVHGGLVAGLWLLGGADVALFAFVGPYLVAAALGAYLFYAQHNFRGVRMLRPEEWTYDRAALESSSFLRTGPVLRYFTGDIGYHHVHHLNPSIPFYRLAETMAALPELQHPAVTTLRPRQIVSCFRCNVWDEVAGELVTWRVARGHPRHRPPRPARPLLPQAPLPH